MDSMSTRGSTNYRGDQMKGKKTNKVVAEEIAITELPQDAVASQADELGSHDDDKTKGKKNKNK
jgi:hypothetical protein